MALGFMFAEACLLAWDLHAEIYRGPLVCGAECGIAAAVRSLRPLGFFQVVPGVFVHHLEHGLRGSGLHAPDMSVPRVLLKSLLLVRNQAFLHFVRAGLAAAIFTYQVFV